MSPASCYFFILGPNTILSNLFLGRRTWMVGEEQCGHPGRQSLKGGKIYTVEFYLSGRWLSRSPIIRRKAINITYSECVCLQPQLLSISSPCAILHCRLWPAWPCHVFPHYLIKVMIFGKKMIVHKMCAQIFCTNLVRKNSYSKKNSENYCHKCTNVFT